MESIGPPEADNGHLRHTPLSPLVGANLRVRLGQTHRSAPTGDGGVYPSNMVAGLHKVTALQRSRNMPQYPERPWEVIILRE